MSKTNKIGIFGVLLFATMMMLVPASLADIYASGKKDRDYDDRDYYERHYIEDDYYDDSYKKKPAVVEITKELFVCDNILNVTRENTSFNCDFNEFLEEFPAPPESEEYVSCDSIEGCLGIDESDWSVQVLKDVAAARDLSSTVPTPIDLTKINFYVTEDETDDNLNNLDNSCVVAGFDDSLFYRAILSETTWVSYDICVLFEGECDGPIYPGEVKECTAKNFIHSGNFNTANGND